jgi:protein-S-isoprenylcysteine O-methyltransferase Ste14
MAHRHPRQYAIYTYGVIAYLLGLATIAYAVGFLADAIVPKSVDTGTLHTLGEPLTVDIVLIALFGLQHSVMARPSFKAQWTRFVPKPIERSTYVLFASFTFLLLIGGWRPLPTIVWHVEGVLALFLWAIYVGGWLLMFAAVQMIDGDDLLGLRQVRAYRDGRELTPLDFQTPALYRFIRHPIMTGFLIAFWVTPRMTWGHLVFAAGMTIYILVGVTLEQRDLVAAFGDQYKRYRSQVPMFIPRPGRSVSSSPDDTDSH